MQCEESIPAFFFVCHVHPVIHVITNRLVPHVCLGFVATHTAEFLFYQFDLLYSDDFALM